MSRIVKNSLGQEATNRLRTMLLDGRFATGERIIEDRLAAELGISRTPMREALHRLAQEGLLEKRHTGGFALRPLRREEVEDAISIRSMLESHAATLAATRATTKQKIHLRVILQEFQTAHSNTDMPLLIKANEAFHATLREAAHSPLLTQMLMELDGIVERMLRPIVSSHEAGWSEDDHLRILECIEASDGAGAGIAMQEHVLHSKDVILAQMEQYQQTTA